MAGERKGLLKEYGALGRLGAPVLVSQLGVILVSFFDTAMVGNYGTSELAAAAFVNSIYVIPVVMLIGFAGGITPLVGALFTQNNDHEIGRTLRASLQTNLLIAVCFTILLGAFYFLLGLLGQPEEIMPLVRTYYLIILASMIPMALFNALMQTANGLTDTVLPMVAMICANISNVIGNYLLIFGKFGFPELGLAGAGISTLFSRMLALVVLAVLFYSKPRYRSYLAAYRTPGSLAPLRRKIWTTSYPVALQSGIECFLWTFGTIACGWFGKIQLAAYQVVNTMAQLGFMTYISFATATSIRVANMTGLKDVAAVKLTCRAGLHMNLVLATLASLIFMFWSEPLLHLFTDDAEVIQCALLLIAPLVLYQYGDAIQYTYSNALRGTGNVRPLAITAIISYLIVGVPALYLLAVTMDMRGVGVFYSFNIALFTAALLFYLYFRNTLRRGL